MDDPDQYVDFMVKYKDWISIKKLGIREYTKPYEVAFALAGIRGTVDNKAYSFTGLKTSPIDTFVENAMRGTRKGASSLAEAANKFGSSEAKSAVEQACADNRELKPIAEIYLLQKLITAAGYDTGINQTVMCKIWKDLKPPKAPGRMGKGKKKEAEE